MIVIFVGPVCSGKTTAIKFLNSTMNFETIPSASTRDPRSEDQSYNHLEKEEFEEKISQNAFIEYDVYDEHYYGTLKSDIEIAINDGGLYTKALTLEGARELKRLYGDKVLTIFVKPADAQAWIKRVHDNNRASNARLKSYYEEIEASSEFDVEILNGSLSDFFFSLTSVIQEKVQLV